MVWKEGVLIKDFPPEAFTIKCLDDSWALLKLEDGQKRLVFQVFAILMLSNFHFSQI